MLFRGAPPKPGAKEDGKVPANGSREWSGRISDEWIIEYVYLKEIILRPDLLHSLRPTSSAALPRHQRWQEGDGASGSNVARITDFIAAGRVLLLLLPDLRDKLKLRQGGQRIGTRNDCASPFSGGGTRALAFRRETVYSLDLSGKAGSLRSEHFHGECSI